MTVKKKRLAAGRRPSVTECLEAWWRVADAPVGQIMPAKLRGVQTDRPNLCNAFDLYCWQLVGKALVACKTRGVPATKLARLAAHIQCGGQFANFPLHDAIQLDPSDPRGWRSVSRPITEVDRIGVDDAWIARAAYTKLRTVLESVIAEADPYIPPPRSQPS
jgi:hypothetical protein